MIYETHAYRALQRQRALTTSTLFAASGLAGGVLVLGAIVAPLVFGRIPAPLNADVMTAIFLRFDRIALGLALYVVVAELLQLRLAQTALQVPLRSALFLALVLLALVATSALWTAPQIAHLHTLGAQRGMGELGQRLNQLHDWAKRIGTAEIVVVLVYVWRRTHA
jgi:Domain of unknown function (DUF4149)